MRLAFLVLLLANLLLAVWAQGYFGTPAIGREPERLGRQIQPDKLVISATPPAPPAAPAVAAMPDSAPPASSAPSAPPACRRLTGLSSDESRRIADTVKTQPGWLVQPVKTAVAKTFALELRGPQAELDSVLPDLLKALPKAALAACPP